MQPTNLKEHPEGGRFQEVFRSPKTVIKSSNSALGEEKNRSAITHIYFSLKKGEVSRFHRVTSDEVWNLYKGTGIRLITWDGTDKLPEFVTLSAKENRYCHVIPAGMWQAAEPISDKVLVGCSVAPGFEFDDFELIDPASKEAKKICELDPEMSKFIHH